MEQVMDVKLGEKLGGKLGEKLGGKLGYRNEHISKDISLFDCTLQ